MSISPTRQSGKEIAALTFEPLTPERRREMTRRHLLEAAAIVFAQKGFHAATLDEVAAAAGFTKGAVYSNFKSKDDLFLALFDDRIERQFAVTIEVLEDGSHEMTEQLPRVRELLHGGAFFWDDDWTTLYLEFVLYAMRNPEARAKLAARALRERTAVKALMEREYSNVGVAAEHSTRELAGDLARAVQRARNGAPHRPRSGHQRRRSMSRSNCSTNRWA